MFFAHEKTSDPSFRPKNLGARNELAASTKAVASETKDSVWRCIWWACFLIGCSYHWFNPEILELLNTSFNVNCIFSTRWS